MRIWTLIAIASGLGILQQSSRDGLPAELPREVPLGLPPTMFAEDRSSDEQVALGRRLFFDPVLSIDRSVSCSSCHDPAHGFAGPDALSPGVHGRRTLRNTPTLYNRALGKAFRWDGLATTLEEQVLLPISDEREMDLALSEAVERLAADEAYSAAFEQAYGSAPEQASLASALAAFVRRLTYGATKLDRFRSGERDALSPTERGGMWLFESRAGCWKCHAGANFTDEDFHSTGIGLRDGEPEPGRFAVTGAEADRGRFKTPTLRGLVETPPYMHDGSLATLEEVVEFYRRGGNPHEGLDEALSPIEMSDQDARNLVAFLKALSR